jgi:hypothetical protein
MKTCAAALVLTAHARLGAAASQPRTTRLAGAWDDTAGRHFVGLLEASGDQPMRVVESIETPSRAHGLIVEPAGSVLAVARRPGNWMLRWTPGRAQRQWCWSALDRRYGGHAALDARGRLYTAEADLDSGGGLVVVRDARSLEIVEEWPTQGIDVHELLIDADGSVLVANGGVPTRPETGRVKLDRSGMDPSLVRLDARSGKLLGQWRLADPRLSIRHLARHASGVIGAALQSEHDDPAERDAAPLLALFDGERLHLAPQPHALAGYAGDIAATRDGFAVAATRGHCVSRWRVDGRWLEAWPLADACPIASDDEIWAGGRAQALHGETATTARSSALPAIRLDNHWVRCVGPA